MAVKAVTVTNRKEMQPLHLIQIRRQYEAILVLFVGVPGDEADSGGKGEFGNHVVASPLVLRSVLCLMR